MNLPITPYESVGPLRLGMGQAEVRAAMATGFKSFKRSLLSQMPLDHFVSAGIYVSYRLPGVCEAVEMCSPANPTFRGYRLMGLPFDQLAEYFQREDPAVKLDADGLTSKLFGLGLYVPDLPDSPQTPVESVIVFARGYYG